MPVHPEKLLAQTYTLPTKLSLSTIPPDLFVTEELGTKILQKMEETMAGDSESVMAVASLFDDCIKPYLKKGPQRRWHSMAAMFGFMGCCLDQSTLRVYANWYPRRESLGSIPDLESLLHRHDVPDVDSALIELYSRPAEIDTSLTLKQLLHAARIKSVSTGFVQPLQDIIKEIDKPEDPPGMYNRDIKLSPWLPSSIPRLLEGAAKSLRSDDCALALVYYGIDALPALNAAAGGSDVAMRETAQDILRVLGSFNIDKPSEQSIPDLDAK